MISKDILKEIIISQREFLNNLDLGILRENNIEISDSFAVLITGVRRCGKSTFLNQISRKQKNWYYLNLEDPRLDGFELTDFNKVEVIITELYGENGIYFFDEIQNIDKWEKFIRYLVDKKEKIIITGSNASLLSRELGTKLTGRHLQSELFPFSFKEFLSFKNENPSVKFIEEYLVKGGFPEYLKNNNPAILNELLSDVIMKDIAVRFGIKNTSILIKIAIFLISNVGKEFSYNSIKNMFKIKSVQSVIDYIFYLENAYLIFTIPRFSYSYKQQQINPKKVYSIDNGFSNVNSVSFSDDKGKMLENIVFLNLRRKHKEIFYFREKNECDFIIKDKGKAIQAIQVCLEINEENQEREINGIKEAMSKLKINNGIMITLNQEDRLNNIKIIPVWKWLLND